MKRSHLAQLNHALVQHEWLSDEESLLIQLLEHMAKQGFFLNDATEEEIQAGQWPLKCFMDQESGLMLRLVPPETRQKLTAYLLQFDLDHATLRQKIRQRCLKSFDQLAQGKSHSFNIRRNIHLGLMNLQQHVLKDLLLYLCVYHELVITPQFEEPEPEEDAIPADAPKLGAADVLKMRSEIMDRLGKHKFVEMIVNDIKKKHGSRLPKAAFQGGTQIKREPVRFIRPSQSAPVTHSKPRLPATNHMQPQSSFQQPVASSQVASSPTPQTTHSSNTTAPAQQQPPSKKSERKATKRVEIVEEVEEDVSFNDITDDELQEATNEREMDANVIYGTGKITRVAMMQFVNENPNSAIAFLFRRSLDGKPVDNNTMKIYDRWEDRGMRRPHIRKYLMELMEWQKLPSISLYDMYIKVRDRIYDLTHDG